MKKLFLLTIALSFGLYTIGQQRAVVPAKDRNFKTVKKLTTIKDGVNKSNQKYQPGKKAVSMLDQEVAGFTTYDMQGSPGPQNRLYLYDDGTMGTTWTMSHDPAGNAASRGTGYNYFDGAAWGEQPTERIEDTKTGWPSYTDYGENGELFVCHHMTEGLLYGIRETKGTGDWVIDIQEGPTEAKDISWPRGVTTGENNDVMHFLSITFQEYLGQDGALLYSRSDDGGLTWEPENHNFEDLGVDYCDGYRQDVYEWAEPNAGQLAFIAGYFWTDLVLMKSDNDGESWDMTKIWESPFPQNLGNPTDTFYCPDGSHHLAIDDDGEVHVVFSVVRVQTDDFDFYTWFPSVDGIVYWNEDMPTFSSNLNALSPYPEDPGTELVEDYNLIGWSQDLNENGEIDIVDINNIADYGTGLSSHAQLVIDDLNRFYLVYSSVTETYVNVTGDQNYRHIWIRGSEDGGNTWGEFVDMHSHVLFSFDECVYSSVATTTDGNIYFQYQVDEEPGTNMGNDADQVTDNWMKVMSVSDEVFFPVDIEENKVSFNAENVSQNYPNPFNGTSSIFVTLDKVANLELTVTNIVGQNVYQVHAQQYNKGRHEMVIEATSFPTGVYFYTVDSGDKSVTKKMIVD